MLKAYQDMFSNESYLLAHGKGYNSFEGDEQEEMIDF